ncbi:aspartate ammonia-lyase [Lacticaseibacillus baoqingensis]|uniref:Aspartate ammonia-lyase n=1 Tax=Lacticaseibacillus baoqingensis TaxID=2486013 RepID=A0ABW4E715_9LACO|nr:aspartate ammonia-lyase [Lacticaseibacillus baoqingensis]
MHYEEDCIGRLAVPDDVLYGVHTLRALDNFPIGPQIVHPALIQALIMIKQAAAGVNQAAGTLSAPIAQAIDQACWQLRQHAHPEAFPIAAIQGGAGTSTNMNVNEVIAKLATQLSGVTIHPNDHVNQSQSTNDVYPTAGKMALLQLLPALLAAVAQLTQTLRQKAAATQTVLKVGRTQLQDAVPTTWGHSFNAYASMFTRDLHRLRQAAGGLKSVNLGATAIGTGVNASDYYRHHIVAAVSACANLPLQPAADLFDATQDVDVLVTFSAALKALAVNLNKFCNDLRLLGSGPQAGFNELRLPARQAGSSIMPGKVNPVIPEAVNQVCFAVIGQDVTVTMAAEAGQLELNAFEPVIFASLFTSMTQLTQAVGMLSTKCVAGLQVNAGACRAQVEHSAIAATVLVPYLGYERTMRLIKTALATDQAVPDLLAKQQLLPPATIAQIFSPASLTGQAPAAAAVNQ